MSSSLPTSQVSQPLVQLSSQVATAFDASYYPHIMDRILEFAPFESLLRLRATCRAFKKHADERLIHHVHLVDHSRCNRHLNIDDMDEETYNQEVVAMIVRTVDGHRLPMLSEFPPDRRFYPRGDLDRPGPTPRIIDVMTDVEYGSTHVLCNAMTFDTIRTYERGDSPIPILSFASARRHIHFTDLELSTEDETVIPEQIQKLVINIQYDEDYRRWTNNYLYIRPDLSTVKEFVVIFNCVRTRGIMDSQPEADATEAEGSPEPLTSGVVWPLVFLAYELWQSLTTHRFTIVNYPADKKFNPVLFPRQWDIDCDLRSDPIAFRNQFANCLKQEIIQYNESDFEDTRMTPEEIQAGIDTIEFIDLETYRARVGEEEFNVEMDRSCFQDWKSGEEVVW